MLRLDISVSSIAVAAALCTAGAAQAVTVTPTTDANALAAAITGTGITVSNATLTFDTASPSGTFTGGLGSVGFDQGIVLTTGTTNCVPGPNNQGSCSGSGMFTSLKFDFVSSTGSVFFQYVFGSEEYNSFVNSSFNDTFQLLLDGTNIAQLPGGAGPVTINNVNCLTNPEFYRNNRDGEGNQPPGCVNQGLDIQYDGLTTVLTAFGSVSPGTHTFEFIVRDVGDNSLDSGVFIQGGSFAGTPINGVPEPTPLALLGLGAAVLAGGRRRNA